MRLSARNKPVIPRARDVRVKGDSNLTAGRDVVFKTTAAPGPENFSEIFKAADQRFCTELVSSGVITRKDQEIYYSSEELFTSLMRIGIPFEPSIRIPFQVIPVLEEIIEDREPKFLDTADLRIAVVRCISTLTFGGRSQEEVAMWSTAYVRRYGNPSNQFVKVIDNEREVDLNYRYLREVIVSHVVRRIIGAEKFSDPIQDFRVVFSSKMVDRMCREIVHTVNTLNIYSIRYRTLIHLIEDLGLEPPHPWLVNPDTMEKVCGYNAERARYHLGQLSEIPEGKSPAFFNQSARECLRHLCAIMLTRYGAFLGVGSRYGLLELRRLLTLKKRNPVLWEYCDISKIGEDLKAHGYSVRQLIKELERVWFNLNADDRLPKFLSLQKSAAEMAQLVVTLFPDVDLDLVGNGSMDN